MEATETIALKIIQISDLEITRHRNLLTPLVEHINREEVDLVVLTGDTVKFNEPKLYDQALKDLNHIRFPVYAIPGDYDNGPLWKEYFGESYKALQINGFSLDLLDTSFMGHRFAVGWGDVLSQEDPVQSDWLLGQLKQHPNYHLIFSHHPFSITPHQSGDKYLTDNVRCIFSGHLHEPQRFFFKYEKPLSKFTSGITSTPLRFHGSSCYLLILLNANGEMATIPRAIETKVTAW